MDCSSIVKVADDFVAPEVSQDAVFVAGTNPSDEATPSYFPIGRYTS
jgi:hypothetical protein